MTINEKDLEDIQNKDTFFEFPCQFPIKIMANSKKETTQSILSIFETYVLEYDKIDFRI